MILVHICAGSSPAGVVQGKATNTLLQKECVALITYKPFRKGKGENENGKNL